LPTVAADNGVLTFLIEKVYHYCESLMFVTVTTFLNNGVTFPGSVATEEKAQLGPGELKDIKSPVQDALSKLK